MTTGKKCLLMGLTLMAAACADRRDEPEPGGVALEWVPPSQYDDGGALPEDAVTEYRVYVDQEMVQRLEPHITDYYLELPAGEWDVAISAVVGGVESRLSEQLNVVIE